MGGLIASFLFIKIRQRAIAAKEQLIIKKTLQAQDAIRQFEALQEKRKVMLKTALTTAGLLESTPRSVLLASLTNNLPAGVSLVKLSVIQKEPKNTNRITAKTSKYKQAQAKKEKAAAEPQPDVSPEKLLETHMDIEGLAPTDLQVAAYIERLSSSTLLENVALVESKEHKVDETIFRQFKLKAMLNKDHLLSSNDIEVIRTRGKNSSWSF
jgi:hypothetical protein